MKSACVINRVNQKLSRHDTVQIYHVRQGFTCTTVCTCIFLEKYFCSSRVIRYIEGIEGTYVTLVVYGI